MALKEWNINLGGDKVSVVKNAAATAVAGGAVNLGGTIGLRILIDDAVVTSKQEALRAIETINMRLTEDTWPPA